MKKLTTDEFVRKSRLIHGNKYDYSKVVYINVRTKVCITCPNHGDFWQRPEDHLKGCGCKECRRHTISKKEKGVMKEKLRGVVCGVGINDYLYSTKKLLSYERWFRMLKRCYSDSYHEKEPTYKDCFVCDEWLYFSNFKKWFDENYVEGYHLDKDILVKGNKIYSPDTCCFVPQEINNLLTKRQLNRGDFPIGVGKLGKKFYSNIFKNRKSKHLGMFDTPEAAFYAYKEAKEAYIKEVAQEYYDAGKITKRVYDALMNYKVEITD